VFQVQFGAAANQAPHGFGFEITEGGGITFQCFEKLLVAETGKPLVDCRGEVARTIVTWQASAEEVSRLHGETVPLDLLASGRYPFAELPRRIVGLDDVDDLIRAMAGEGDPPPVHGVVAPHVR